MGVARLLWIGYLLALISEYCWGAVGETDLNDLSHKQHAVRVNKCCENYEIMLDNHCRNATPLLSAWQPVFWSEDGRANVQVPYFTLVNGVPDCETQQQRPIYHLPQSEDSLEILPDGRLRHYISHEHKEDSIIEPIQIGPNVIQEHINVPKEKNIHQYYDYSQGKYCVDKIHSTDTNTTNEFALICVPNVNIDWTDTDFLMKKILNPVFHSIAIIIYLLVAIVYFILPSLRDLSGNIITTIAICFIVSQAASLVRIFTELSSHVSFMITDIILYISLLAAFFWLNSFGFYIWKTFKSRNVFLRVTDMRKYCYYSSVVWITVAAMTTMAIVAHFFLDVGLPDERRKKQFSSSIITNGEQDTIGWLGIAIFFTPVAFTVLINIFFYVTTLQVIKRINTYGRIHYKLKRSFDLFMQLCLIMTSAWIFLLMSWLEMDGLLYAHVFVNLAQAVLFMYVCVLRQSHITFLLRKSCCYAEPVPTGEWGDEMTQMNGNYGY